MKYISIAKQTKELNYKKEIIISELRADQRVLDEHKQRIISLFKDASENEINSRIEQIVLRDNAFNAIMNDVVSNFDISLDSNELEKVSKQVEEKLKNTPEISLEIAKKIITKSIIFSELAKKWDIEISDSEVKRSLEQYYKTSNQPIRDYFENQEKFEEIRGIMLDETIVNELLRRYKGIRFDLKKRDEQNPA